MGDKKQRRWQEWGGYVAWYHHNTDTIVSLCWERRTGEGYVGGVIKWMQWGGIILFRLQQDWVWQVKYPSDLRQVTLAWNQPEDYEASSLMWVGVHNNLDPVSFCYPLRVTELRRGRRGNEGWNSVHIVTARGLGFKTWVKGLVEHTGEVK